MPKEEWITVENMHEPIIDKELFERAQVLRKVDTRVQENGSLSIWAGKLKCADCGYAMHKKYCTNKSGKTYEYYICGTYRKKSNQLCTKHTIKVEELESIVLEVIKLHINLQIDTEKILQQINKTNAKKIVNKDIENMKKLKQKEIEKISNLKRGLYEDWKSNNITKQEYLEYKQKYEKDIIQIKKIVFNLEKQEQRQNQVKEQKNEWIESFRTHKNITKLDRDIITELIDYIEVHENKKITIHFKFKNELEKILEYIEKAI